MRGGAPCRVTTFGLGETAEWRATGVRGGSRRDAIHRGASCDPVTEVRVRCEGSFNVRNVLARRGCLRRGAGRDDDRRVGRRVFEGVRRRLESPRAGTGVTVYDDFAHHRPRSGRRWTGSRASNPSRRIWALFAPRSATAAGRVSGGLRRGVSQADEVIIGRVYRSSLPEADPLSETELVAGIGAAGSRTAPGQGGDIVRTVVDEARDGDLVIVMSNGAFGESWAALEALAASTR